MIARQPTTAHWIFLGGLIVLTAIAALFWSTRGAGNPNPHQIHQPVAQIGRTAAEERSLMIMRSMLLCMDAISKHVPAKAVSNCSTAIALLPNDTNALKLRGSAYLMQHRTALAAADFSRAVQLRLTMPMPTGPAPVPTS